MHTSGGTGAVAAGAATGAWVSLSVGNMGLAFSGTAVSLGLTPLTAAGAVAGAAGFGVFRAIATGDPAALQAALLGGAGGAAVSVQVGGMGLAFSGTAIGLGLAPVTLAGGVVGLAVYGLVKMLEDSSPPEPVAQVFDRMEEKIADQEAYQQALLELTLAALEQKFATLDLEAELEELRQKLQPKLQQIPALQATVDILKTERQRLKAELSSRVEGPLDLNFTEFTELALAPPTEATPAFGQADSQPTDRPEPPPNAAPETAAVAVNIQSHPAWECVRELSGHQGVLSAIAIAPEHQLLATGSRDRSVRLWDFPSGQWRFTFWGQAQEVTGVAFSPDGQELISSSQDGKVTAWNLHTRTLRHTFRYPNAATSHKGFVHAVLCSPTGQVISGGDDSNIHLWNLKTGQLIRTLKGHTAGILSLALSRDRQTLVSGGADHTLRIWRLPDGELLHTLTGHRGWIFALAIHPIGQILASGDSQGQIRIWNLSTGEPLGTFTADATAVESLAFSPDGRQLAAGNQSRINLWDYPAQVLRQTLEGRGPVAFSPDGQTLFSGSPTGSLKLHYPTGSPQRFRSPTQLTGAWWQILSVAPQASSVEVRAAFRQLVRAHHPDLNPSDTAKEEVQKIIQAYKEFRQNQRQNSKSADI